MPARAEDTLARLRVCRDANRGVPADLVSDTIEIIEALVESESLRARRDALIRRAALLLPADRPYAQAARLLEEQRTMNRTWHLLRGTQPSPTPDTPRACLHAAALYAPLPRSQRHFYRILAKSPD
ncbi:hypothetical protein GCM10011521_05950 [Arenimonas soli]|uniref:Uncharacterized protein n=1 Tax=Arenimonas soli TaxID=2269504 RepID=A0ABQ1HC82_9GAMM|nr:hypothetical protein GCM10011521_05950 [Arenimonas soli]